MPRSARSVDSASRTPRLRTGQILTAAIVLGALIRLRAAGVSGLWSDEGQFLFVVRMQSLGEMLQFLGLHESHPPLFYLLMRAWLGLFGDTETAALGLPLVLGVLLIPTIYVVGLKLFSRDVALLAALLVTASPYLSRYSAFIRPYSLLPLLVTSAVYFLWRALQSGRTNDWGAYALFTVAVLLTHNWGWLVFGAQNLVVLVWLVSRAGRDSRRWIVQWVGANAAVVAAYAPWLRSLQSQLDVAGHGGREWWSLYLPLAPLVELSRVTLGHPRDVAFLLLMVLCTAAVVQSRPAIDSPGGRSLRLAIALCIGVPLLATLAAAAFSGRSLLMLEYCLLSVAPLLLLGAAYGMVSILGAGTRRVLLTLPVGVAVVYVLSWAALANRGKSNAREIASALEARVGLEDLIVVSPAWLAAPFNYYFRPTIEQIDYPFSDRRGALAYDRFLERIMDPEGLEHARGMLAAAHARNRAVWLVTECRWLDETVQIPERVARRGSEMQKFAAVARGTRALRNKLRELYGEPQLIAGEDQEAPLQEVLCAELFASSSSGVEKVGQTQIR